MAILSFNPQTLDNWVNDETKLNAQNMNKIKDAIVYINDSILDKNGKGIISEVNNLHRGVWGVKNNVGEDVSYGIYKYLEKVIPQIYGRNVKFDTTPPNNLHAKDEFKEYMEGTYVPTKTVLLETGTNDIASLGSQFDAEGVIDSPYYGLVQAAYNTQLYSEYTRMRLYAVENQYKPSGIFFKDSGTTTFTTSSTSSKWSTSLNIEVLSASNDVILKGKNVQIVATKTDNGVVKLTGSNVAINGFNINTNSIVPDGTVNTDTFIGSESKPFTKLFVNDVLASYLQSTTLTTSELTSTNATIENATLTGNLSGGTIDSAVLNNVQLNGTITPVDNESSSLGSSEKQFKDVYATNLYIDAVEITGEQGTSDNSIVKYETFVAEKTIREENDLKHDGDISNLQSEVAAIKEDIGSSVPVSFDDKQFDVIENVASLKSFNEAEEGSYAVKSNGALIWKKTTSTTAVDAASVTYNNSDVKTALDNTSSSLVSLALDVSNKANKEHTHDGYQVSYTKIIDEENILTTVYDALEYLFNALEVIDDGSID